MKLRKAKKRTLCKYIKKFLKKIKTRMFKYFPVDCYCSTAVCTVCCSTVEGQEPCDRGILQQYTTLKVKKQQKLCFDQES